MGNAFAAGWIPDRDGETASRLWVSTAAEEPSSQVLEVPAGEEIAAVDPAEAAIHEARGVFLPMLSPDGRLAIYWSGRMTPAGGQGWIMSQDGEPYLAEHDVRDETYEFDNERPLFSDLRVEEDGFASAAITWGSDGDALRDLGRGMDRRLTGPEDVAVSDPLRVYFGHATDRARTDSVPRHRRGRPPEDGSVVDVKVSPTGHHLLVTVRYPLDGTLSVPRADLLLIKRNTGDVRDDVADG